LSGGRIRPFVDADVAAVATLRRERFRVTQRQAPEDLAAYIRTVFLQNPWRDDDLPSLVYEGAGGRIAGFVGVIPRRMAFRGRTLRVVVSTQFMVDPTARGAAGVLLVRRLFAGPQDLTLGDAAPELVRRIWAGMGGTVAPLHSLFWTCPLRPARHAAAELGDHVIARSLRLVLRPVLNALDGAGGWVKADGPHRVPPQGTVEPFDPATAVAALPAVLGWRGLYPVYDEPALRWLLDRVAELTHLNPLRAGLVRGPQRDVVGWFLYFANPGGVAQVMQVAATEQAAPLVFRHLQHDAWRGGATAIAGRLDPPLLPAVVAAGSTIHRRGPWVLVQSRRPEILDAVACGDAWVTSLDGERWLSF
jgi:hypothetical protein